MSIDIAKAVENARYSDILESLLDRLKAKKILRLAYESSWQGEVDVDVLLEDGRVFSYDYSYGSCSGCDEWEAEGLNDPEIEAEMEKQATFFNNLDDYLVWRSKVENKTL